MASEATSQSAVQTIVRIFDAPRGLVWKAWTNPEYVKKWWGPKGFTSPLCRIDFRVGGRFTYAMQAPDGKIYYNGGEFREIVPLERIVWLWHFADANGDRVSPVQYGFPDEEREGNVDVILFEDHGSGQTKLTYMQDDPTASKEDRQGAAEGYAQIFDKLAVVLDELVSTAGA